MAIIVPNSQLVSNEVVNWSAGDPRLGIAVDVGVSYESDIDSVLEVLAGVARVHALVLDVPEPVVRFQSFGDSSWNMRLFRWIGDAKDHFRVASDLHIAIARAFRDARIEIPYPQRDVHFRSNLVTEIPPAPRPDPRRGGAVEFHHSGTRVSDSVVVYSRKMPQARPM